MQLRAKSTATYRLKVWHHNYRLGLDLEEFELYLPVHKKGEKFETKSLIRFFCDLFPGACGVTRVLFFSQICATSAP